MISEQLREVAANNGFAADSVEKVWMLVRFLGDMVSHPYLKSRFALKGGTALNLFVFDLPRLSVDIDINYIGAIDRPTMMAERSGVSSRLPVDLDLL